MSMLLRVLVFVVSVAATTALYALPYLSIDPTLGGVNIGISQAF